jgi:hypothetical protein
MSGTGPPRGESFRADVAAHIWVHILCETPLWEQFPGGVYPVSFQLESAECTDDIVVKTNVQGRLFAQCKRKVDLSDKENSPFASAIEQFVAQYQKGTLTPGTDWLVLAYSAANRSIDKMHEILGRFRDGTPSRAEALLLDPEKRLFGTLERAVRNAWLPTGTSPSWDELAALVRMFRFVELRVGPEYRCEIDPYRRLEQLLMNPMDHSRAVTELRDQCLTSAGLRSVQDAQGGRKFLRSKGICLREPLNLRDDWAQLRKTSDIAMKELCARGRLRWGNQLLHVSREILQDLELESRSASLVMAGAPGDGKSSLLAELATKLRAGGRQVVLLRADDIFGSTPDAIRTDLKLAHRLDEILAGAADPLPAYLLVDTLEATLTDIDRESAWRKLIEAAKADTVRWRVIASIRHIALDHSGEWRELFGGTPIGKPSSSATEKVRHIAVPPLTVTEQEALFQPLPSVWEALRAAPPVTQHLLATPFNLRLMMDSSTPETFVANKIMGQHALLDAYWKKRVLDTSDPFGRKNALREIASRSTRLTLTHTQLVANGVTAAVIDALVLDGVLRRNPKSGHVAFCHSLIEEYVLSLSLDDDLGGLAEFLAKPGVA